MAIQNSLGLSATGIITADGAGAFSGSAVTEGAVVLGGASNAVSDTGVLAKGVILVGDGAGAPTELTVGADDTLLTADSGEASGVKWAAAAGGGGAWQPLSSATASSSAEIVFDSGIDSTYDQYMITYTSVIPATDNVEFYTQFSIDGGSTYISSAYATSAVRTNGISYNQAQIKIISAANIGNDSNQGISGNLLMYDPSSTAVNKNIIFDGTYVNSNTTGHGFTGSGGNSTTSAVDAIRFYMSSGNIASGVFRLYGLSNS